jgi:hypothetical protein
MAQWAAYDSRRSFRCGRCGGYHPNWRIWEWTSDDWWFWINYGPCKRPVRWAFRKRPNLKHLLRHRLSSVCRQMDREANRSPSLRALPD